MGLTMIFSLIPRIWGRALVKYEIPENPILLKRWNKRNNLGNLIIFKILMVIRIL